MVEVRPVGLSEVSKHTWWLCIEIQIEGDQLDLSLFVPEVYTSHDILKSLDLNAKLVNKDGGKCHWKRDGMESKWRNMCAYNDGWFDCWTAPSVQLDVTFVFHPIPLGT